MENEIQDIIAQLRALTARLEALLPPAEQASQPATPTETPTAPTHTISFTLNDRYRFLRELFGNSADEMHRVLTALEDIENEAETIGYISAMGWDEESQVVKDFTAAVTERFKSTPTLLA